MNVTAHQKKKNKETKTGKRKADERRQATDFKEAVCCPSAVVQGAAQRKNDLCERSARLPGVTGTLGKTNSHFDPTQTGSEAAPTR